MIRHFSRTSDIFCLVVPCISCLGLEKSEAEDFALSDLRVSKTLSLSIYIYIYACIASIQFVQVRGFCEFTIICDILHLFSGKGHLRL